MNNDTALILAIADAQREKEALRAQVAQLETDNVALRQALTEASAPDAP